MGLFNRNNKTWEAGHQSSQGRRQSVRGLQERAFNVWVRRSNKEGEPKQPRRGSFAAERAARAAAREAAGEELVMRT